MANTTYSAVIIQGPAGYGKSTLMQQIRERRLKAGTITSWLTLEETDNDISRFYNCLTVLANAASGEKKDIDSTDDQDSVGDSAVENILRALTVTNKPIALFIDEYSNINEPTNIALLESVIERCPPNITFYIGCRSEPSLVRSRLLISERLKWIRPQELSFNTDEVHEFLASVNLGVSHAEAREFREQTAGWPAILQLLQLALKSDRIDRNSLLAWTPGCEEELADYLADNIMRNQPANRKRFLLLTSILTRFSAPLCLEITGDSDAPNTIRDLISQGLFLNSIDPQREWFKYHSVFSGYLRAQLTRTDRSKVLEIHKSAARWFSKHDYPEDAIYHAVEAQEFELAANILDAFIPELIRNARLQTVDKLCALIPSHIFETRPIICWTRIWAQHYLYQRNTDHSILEELERIEFEDSKEAADLTTSINILRCSQSFVNDDVAALGYWVNSIEIEVGNISKFRCFEMSVLANGKAIERLYMSRFAEAKEWGMLGESLGIRAESAFSRAYSISIICYAMIQDGHLLQAVQQLKTALGNKELKILGSLATASISAIYGFALYESGDYIEAEIHLRDTIDIISQTSTLGWLIPAYLSLARANSLVENESAQTMDLLDDAERAGLLHGHPRMAIAMRRERIRLALVNGHLDKARLLDEIPDRPQESKLPPGATHIEQGCDDDIISRARMSIYCGDPADALAALESALAQAKENLWVRREIKLLILSGLAHDAAGATKNSKEVILKALKLAAPQCYMASFLDEGQKCLTVITQILDEGDLLTRDQQSIDFMSRILQQGGITIPITAESNKIPQLIEQLTKRELAILGMVAGGSSNKEIAEQSYVSYNTVKFHMKNLYSKLGARNRVGLTRAAKKLNLI